MYYKARYYDARIGRFLQQDSMAFPNQVNGMNRMMYVEGNPVSFNDPTGHCPGECNYENALVFSIFFLLYQGKTTLSFPNPTSHQYSGSGNTDFKIFNKLFNKDPNQRGNAYFVFGITFAFLEEVLKFSPDQIGFAFAFILLNANAFRVKPKRKMDEVSQRHDDSAPTGLGDFGNSSDDRYHATGGGGFVRGGLGSLSSIGKWNAGDVAAFGVGVPLYSTYAGFRGSMYNIKTMNIKNTHQKLPDAIGNSAVVMGMLSGNPYLMAASVVGASLIGRSPLRNWEKRFKFKNKPSVSFF
jgi:hypothetical protein